MNTQIITWSVVIIAIVLPFYLISRKISKTKKTINKQIQQLAAENECIISETEYWNKTAIGIDKSKQMLFIVRMVDNNLSKKTIYLGNYSQCKPVIVGQTTNNVKVFEKISLNLLSKQPGIQAEVIEFYNNERDSLTMNGELQVMEKWEKTIDSTLS